MGDEKTALEHTIEQQGGLPRRGAVLADRYRVLGVLGVGGMGSVHRVLDVELDEEVALKLLRPEITRDADALHRFRRELKLARRVTHPNVARTYDIGVHEGTRFITMELIEGSPLSRPIRMSGALPLGEALRVAAEIARGLAAAHAVGIVHRDLKPDNVMMAGERVCLTDFGIARLAEDVAGDTRYTVGPIGTPAYMAPEQVEGRPLDGRADVYALGVLLFECLTGRLPFDAQTALGMAAARLTEDAPDPRAHDPGIPAGVSELVLAMMTRAREERLDAQRALERLDVIRGEGGARVPAIPARAPRRALVPTSDRWAVVVRFDAPDAAALGAQLDEAVQEAFEGLRRFERVRAPASAAPLDDVELAKRSGADLVLRGTVRVAGPRVRLRLRLAERTDGHTLWQQKIDGATDDPFALEDEVVRVVRTFLADRFSTPGTIERGPADPKRREIYLRARALMLEHSRDSYARAIELLEDALAADPNDPWILSRLAAALVRRLSIAGAEVDAKASEARAEELALRALAIDSSIPDTFQTVGVLRWMQGRTRSAVLALREALARDPFLLEAQGLLARLASESGRTEEAIERAHLLLRIEPELGWHVRVVLARIAADRGDREEMEQNLVGAERDAGGRRIALITRVSYASFYHDAEVARSVLATLDASEDWAWKEPIRRFLRHLTGEQPLAWDDPIVGALLRPDAPERARAQASLVHAEIVAALDGPAEAILDSLEDAGRSTLDLAWIDASPNFARIRESPRYARVRAQVAARVADVWA